MTAGVRNIIWCDAVNPSIDQSMNPVLLAVFVIGDAEVSQVSDEITVNCAPLV